MRTKYTPAPKLMERAIDALVKKLGISKASDFWVSLGYGKDDYSKMRKNIFKGESIKSLSAKIKRQK